MPLSWSALHAQLLSVSIRAQTATNYTGIQKDSGGALPPGDISALMAFLRDPSGTPDAKNAVLMALIEAGQQRSTLADTATTLVLLALWPGLDAVRSWLRRFFPGRAEDLAAELVARVTVTIRMLDLARVRRLAATVLRNVERDIRRDLVRQSREAPRAMPVEDLLAAAPAIPGVLNADCIDPAVRRDLAQELDHHIGVDAGLVLLVAVDAFSQREAAEILGISHDTARKRNQRACARLREIY